MGGTGREISKILVLMRISSTIDAGINIEIFFSFFDILIKNIARGGIMGECEFFSTSWCHEENDKGLLLKKKEKTKFSLFLITFF